MDVRHGISVQGFQFIGFNARVKYDSSAVWVSVGRGRALPFLCRALRFFSVSPCCHPDCEEEFVVEILRFETKKDSSVPGGFTCTVRRNQGCEYVSASSLMPKVVVLIPLLKDTPVTKSQRRSADTTSKYGPFLVVDVARMRYQ